MRDGSTTNRAQQARDRALLAQVTRKYGASFVADVLAAHREYERTGGVDWPTLEELRQLFRGQPGPEKTKN